MRQTVVRVTIALFGLATASVVGFIVVVGDRNPYEDLDHGCVYSVRILAEPAGK